MLVTYLGHSCLQIDSDDATPTRLVVDPGVFSDAAPASADAVFLTHAHADHVDPVAIARLAAAGARVIGDAAALEVLRSSGELAGGTTLETAGPGGTWTLGSFDVEAVGGRHAVIHEDMGRDPNIGFLVRSGGTTLFHPGDAYEYTPEGVDVLAVPLAAPWAAAKETIEFVRAVGADRLIPIHDRILSEGGRSFFLGYVAELGGTPVHDPAVQGPLQT